MKCETPMFGRYAEENFSPLEMEALVWLDGFYQLEHLIATRAWLLELYPEAPETLRFAALVHDAERHFPGGPSLTQASGPDDPDYLFAHSQRSADLVADWLNQRRNKPSDKDCSRIRALILRHEFGGNAEEDLIQAADSLAFLSTFDWLMVEWVRSGGRTLDQVQEKLDWMMVRIRVPKALEYALPFYRSICNMIRNIEEGDIDLILSRSNAGNLNLLLGRNAGEGQICNG